MHCINANSPNDRKYEGKKKGGGKQKRSFIATEKFYFCSMNGAEFSALRYDRFCKKMISPSSFLLVPVSSLFLQWVIFFHNLFFGGGREGGGGLIFYPRMVLFFEVRRGWGSSSSAKIKHSQAPSSTTTLSRQGFRSFTSTVSVLDDDSKDMIKTIKDKKCCSTRRPGGEVGGRNPHLFYSNDAKANVDP